MQTSVKRVRALGTSSLATTIFVSVPLSSSIRFKCSSVHQTTIRPRRSFRHLLPPFSHPTSVDSFLPVIVRLVVCHPFGPRAVSCCAVNSPFPGVCSRSVGLLVHSVLFHVFFNLITVRMSARPFFRPSSVVPSVRPSACLTACPSVCPLFRPSVSRSVRLSARSFFRPSVSRSIRPSVHRPARPSVQSARLSAHCPSVRLFVRPSVRLSVRPPVRQSNRQFIHSTVLLPVCASFRPFCIHPSVCLCCRYHTLEEASTLLVVSARRWSTTSGQTIG